METSFVKLDISNVIKLNQTVEEHYNLDKSFLQSLEQEILKEGSFTVDVSLIKSTSNSLSAHLFIKGEIELLCDRSLKLFFYPISISEVILLKLADRFEEISESEYLIPESSATFVFDRIIFDLVALAIPLKKIHPDYKISEDDDESNDDIMIYSTRDNATTEPVDEDIQVLDPRWEALKKLKNNN